MDKVRAEKASKLKNAMNKSRHKLRHVKTRKYSFSNDLLYCN